MDKDRSLVLAFFEQASSVGMGERRYLKVAPDDLLRIASSPVSRAQFQRELALVNDPELHRQIVQFVLDLADTLDDDSRSADRKVDLVDRSGLTLATAITATGIGTSVATVAKAATIGSLAGPVGMLACGMTALVVVGIGRSV